MSKDSQAARSYLMEFLKTQGLAWNHVSLRLGKSHAYIQQYIRTGKPEWLAQNLIDVLVEEYGADGSRLKEPPPTPRHLHKDAGGEGDQHPQINSPKRRQVVEDADTLQLLDVWADIPIAQRAMAIRVLRQFTTERDTIVA